MYYTLILRYETEKLLEKNLKATIDNAIQNLKKMRKNPAYVQYNEIMILKV